MLYTRILALATIMAMMLIAHFGSVLAGDKSEDTIIIGGEHGCGPKLLLKSGGKKRGDILLMNDCHKKQKKHHYIPYPVYHGGYGDSGYGGY